MEKAQNPNARKEDPSTRPTSDDPSKQPPVLATFPVLDIRSEWRPTPVSEPPTVGNPEEEVFLKELDEKFGSKEEAVRIFSRFSAIRQQPQMIPDESTAQPPIPHTEGEGAQPQDLSHAETGPSPGIGEQGKGGDGPEEESVSGFADEIDGMAVDYSVNGAAREGNIFVLPSVEGESPIVKSVEGEPMC